MGTRKIIWPEGNTLPICVKLRQIVVTESGCQSGDYTPPTGSVIEVHLTNRYRSVRFEATLDGSNVLFTDNGTLKEGLYDIVVSIREPAKRLRSYKYGQIEIVKAIGNLKPGDCIVGNAVILTADAFVFGKGDPGVTPHIGDNGHWFIGDQDTGVHAQGDPGTTNYNELENTPDLSVFQLKEDGKGLSANDYTNEDKAKLDVLSNYDDTEIRGMIDRKQNTIDDLDTIRSGAEAGASAYQKPEGGIPSSDIGDDVIPDVSGFITKSVDDLLNYYLKSETYTKSEVQALLGAISQFHFEIYASTSAVVNPQSNVLYLIGPSGSGSDRYEEYVYVNTAGGGFAKIGDTSIDLSGYVTISALNTALADYTTTANLTTLLAGKQDVIDSSHKLSADLIQNGSTNKVYTSTEKDKLSGIESGAQVNVKPDWNAESGSSAEILNKPTIPAEQIQSDWNQTNTNAKDFIKNKPTTMRPSGVNHKGGLVPDTPSTEGTTKFLREDGTWAVPQGSGIDISGKEDKLAIDGNTQMMSFVANESNYYNVKVLDDDTLTITLATPMDNMKVSRCMFLASIGAGSVLALESDNGEVIHYSSSIKESSLYLITAWYDGLCWIVDAKILDVVEGDSGAYWRESYGNRNYKFLTNVHGNIIRLDDNGYAFYIYTDQNGDIRSQSWNNQIPGFTESVEKYGYAKCLASYDNGIYTFTVGGVKYSYDEINHKLEPSPTSWNSPAEELLWREIDTDKYILVNSCGNVIRLGDQGYYPKVVINYNGLVDTLDYWGISGIEDIGAEYVDWDGLSLLYNKETYTISNGTISPDITKTFSE